MNEQVRVFVQFEWRSAGEIRLDPQGRLAFPTLPQSAGL
jgi:hypothetical protein